MAPPSETNDSGRGGESNQGKESTGCFQTISALTSAFLGECLNDSEHGSEKQLTKGRTASENFGRKPRTWQKLRHGVTRGGDT